MLKAGEYRLTLDARKRVSLSKLLPNYEVVSFKAFREGERIVLEPMMEVPAHLSEISQKPESPEISQQSLTRGLNEAELGLVKRCDIDFTKFIDENF